MTTWCQHERMQVASDYLRRTAESPGVRALKEHALDSLALTSGSRVLDVGCGPAIDTIAMARRVGVTGSVVGVDSDPWMVEEANRLAVDGGIGACTRHVVGDATSLAFGEGQFDACFCERVLQHLTWTDAGKAAQEMVRVLRPGGRLAVVDTDWATLSVASANPWLERRIAREHTLQFRNPFSGRSLLGVFRSIGFPEAAVEPFDAQLTAEAVEFLLTPSVRAGVAAGRISPFEAQQWFSEMALGREYGTFFAHVAMVLLVGRKT